MSCLTLKKLAATVSHIAVCGLLLAAVSKPACAEEAQEGVIRTFAVTANSADQTPDFYGEQSLGLVVASPDRTESYTMFFYNSFCDDRYDFTEWECQDVIHITKEGAETLTPVMWLHTLDTPELPPTGAVTFSGPDSPLILNQELFYYEPYGSGYRLRCLPGGGGVFMVVTAIFSR